VSNSPTLKGASQMKW